MPSDSQTYSLPAKTLHWVIALAIFGLLAVGFYMHSMEASPLKWQLYGLHKATGILVLALVALRLAVMFVTPHPVQIESHARWEKFLTRLVKVLFWVCMLGLPLSGWVMSSAGGHPVSFYGLFEVPPIVDKNPDLGKLAYEAHELMAFGIIGLIVLHFAGALKHQFMDKDATIARMSACGTAWGPIVFGVLGLLAVAAGFAIPKLF